MEPFITQLTVVDQQARLWRRLLDPNDPLLQEAVARMVQKVNSGGAMTKREGLDALRAALMEAANERQ